MTSKCDLCGRESKSMKTRRNYPFGVKSKARTTKTCPSCDAKRGN